VACELDLHGLSQMTTSVSAFQVLTIGSIGDANLEVSVRSFMRHVNADLIANMLDPDKERKRKRGSGLNSHNHITRSPVVPRSLPDNISTPKRVRSEEDAEVQTGQINRKLPRSIESLYESIMSAQKEMEVGRAWEADELMEL
jgi:hypothetical protein